MFVTKCGHDLDRQVGFDPVDYEYHIGQPADKHPLAALEMSAVRDRSVCRRAVGREDSKTVRDSVVYTMIERRLMRANRFLRIAVAVGVDEIPCVVMTRLAALPPGVETVAAVTRVDKYPLA